ncbi:hypothetical protein BJ170DRAFT_683971 [Xylariales sp. AK1849]|nr:hypothetical protein BJ170DRAFT_683971 [Xylariales sp. AK1849]
MAALAQARQPLQSDRLHGKEAAVELLEKRVAKSLFETDDGSRGCMTYRKLRCRTKGSRSAVAKFASEIGSRRTAVPAARTMDNPDDMVHPSRSRNMLKTLYGYAHAPYTHGPLLDDIYMTMSVFQVSQRTRRLARRRLPRLRHLPDCVPGIVLKQAARRWNKDVMEALHTPLEFVVQRVAHTRPNPPMSPNT